MNAQVSIKFPPYFQEFTKPARYKGLHGGRGSGKSHCFAGYAILRMVSEPNLRVVCCREIQRSIADSVKTLLEDKIENFGLTAFFNITEQEITGINGSRCIFRGLQNHTAASIKSLENFSIAFIEEAQTISAKSLELLTPTIRSPGSEIWAAWNPANENDPIDVLLRGDHPPDDCIIKEVNWDDNPWFPEELRGDMERDRLRDPDKYNHVWGGQYRGLSEARVFRNWKIGEMEPREDCIWYYGVDWGFANDETAAMRCCFPDNKTIYVDHEVYELGVPTEALPAFLNGLPDARKWPMRADSARPESIDHVKRHGFPKLRRARKGAGSIEDGVSFLQGFDIVVHPRCANMARELSHYAYKKDARTDELLPVVEDKNNHLVDAFRYAVEGLHRKGRVIPKMIEPVVERLERPKDYQDHRRRTDGDWKTA